jgi:hypothetical protein
VRKGQVVIFFACCFFVVFAGAANKPAELLGYPITPGGTQAASSPNSGIKKPSLL